MRVKLFHTLPAEGRTSSEVYARELATALVALQDPDLVLEHCRPGGGLRQAWRHSQRVARGAGFIDRYVAYQWRAGDDRADVNHLIDHGYGHLALSLDRDRTLLTFHDAILLKIRAGELATGGYSRITGLGHRLSLEGITRCSRVIADSENSRRDLLRFSDIDPVRTRVVYLGVSSRFHPTEPGPECQDVLGPRDGLRILHVGHSGFYKNVEGILQTLAILTRRLNTRVTFVRVGAPLTPAQMALALRLNVADRIVSLVGLDDRLLPSVYRECDALIMPSFYEGFGLPALEAMASGVPVVASDRGSLPEVVGDAALLVDPEDMSAIADQLERALTVGDVRDHLQAAGLARAAEFTWRRTAEQTLEVYREVYALEDAPIADVRVAFPEYTGFVPAGPDMLAASDIVLRQQLVTNTLVQLIAPILRTVLGLVLVATLSRYLGVNGFGEYALVVSYALAASGVAAGWGLDRIVLRELARHPLRRPDILGSAFVLQIGFALGGYAILVGSAFVLGYDEDVRTAIAILGATLLLSPIDILALAFQADLRLWKLVGPSLVGTSFNFLFIMGAVGLGRHLIAIALGGLLALLIQYALIGALCARTVRLGRPETAYWRLFLLESWPIAVSAIFTTGLRQLPLLALSTVSVQAAGIYNAANRIPNQLTLVPLAVREATFPLLSRSWVARRRRFIELLQTLISGSFIVSVPAFVLAIGFAPDVVGLLFGEEFMRPGALPFGLLMAAFVLSAPLLMFEEAFVAAGAQRRMLLIQLAFAPIFVFLVYEMRRYGAVGVAVATLLVTAGIVGTQAVGIRALVASRMGLFEFAPAVAATVIGVVTSRWLNELGVSWAPFGGAASSLSILLLFARPLRRQINLLRRSIWPPPRQCTN